MATDNIALLADLAEAYYAKLALLLDNYASVRNNAVTLRPRSPRFTSEIKEQKVKRRTLERLWQKTRLTVDRAGNLLATMCSRSQAHSYVQSKPIIQILLVNLNPSQVNCLVPRKPY